MISNIVKEPISSPYTPQKTTGYKSPYTPQKTTGYKSPSSISYTPAGGALNSFMDNYTQKPSTPIKSVSSDGTNHTITYHAPQTDTPTSKTTSTPTEKPFDAEAFKKNYEGLMNAKTTPSVSESPAPVADNNTLPPVTYPGIVGNLADTSSKPSAQYTDLSNQASQAYKNAGETNQIIGQAKSDALHNPNYSLDTGIGRAGQIEQNYGLMGQNALTQAQGLESLAGKATTQQGTQQSGLSSAGTLAKTEPTSQGQTTYNPLTNSFSGGSYGTNLQTVVQAIKSGNMGYTDGVNSLSSLSPTAKADVLSALGAGFDTIKSDAQAGIKTQQTVQVAGYQSALQQGQNLASQTTDLITKFNLNPSELNKANGAIQLIAKNTSSPEYKMLNNYLADISSRYSQILTPAGGSSTDTTRAVASGMLDGLASGKSLQTVLNGLDQQAQAVISGVPTSGGNNGGGASNGNSWNDIFGA